MQRFFIIGFLLVCGFGVTAQIELIRTLESGVRCEMGESNNAFKVARFTHTGRGAEYLRAVEVINDNMTFRFSLPKLIPGEYYELEWTVTIGSREYRIAPERMSRHVIRADEQTSVYEVIWYSPFDEVPFGLQEFDVILQANFYGKPCPFAQGSAPSFTWKQQRNYVGAALLGGAIVGLAEVTYASQARKDYAKYEDLITTEPLSPPSLQESNEAAKLLQQAKDNESTASFVRRTGQVIIAGSVVVYAIRYLKFKKDYRKWQRYCADVSPAIGLTPMYDTSTPGQSIGLAFTLTF